MSKKVVKIVVVILLTTILLLNKKDYVSEAENYFNHGEYEKAVASWEKVSSLGERMTYQMAISYRELKDYSKAYQTLNLLTESTNKQLLNDVAYQQIINLFFLNDFQEVINVYKTHKKELTTVEFSETAIEQYVIAADIQNKVNYAYQVLEMNEENIKNVHYFLRKYEKVDEKKEPFKSDIMGFKNSLVTLYMMEKENQLALQTVNELLAMDSTVLDFHLSKAHILNTKYNKMTAIKYLDSIKKQFPNDQIKIEGFQTGF
ncbi:MAG: tetratricopeptide repeat protein [Bacilli bacterium]